MHSYHHHIKDFNNDTRHLTRVERSLYRDAIELYYETEQPLPADDFDRLARRLLAFTEEEKTALRFVLDEFFELTGGVYSHDRCDEEIDKYREAKTAKSAAGKASAEARRKKAESRKKARREQKGTGAERVLDSDKADRQQNPTNQEPRTSNQEPVKDTVPNGTASPPVPYQAIVDLYHEILPSLTDVKRLNTKRKTRIRQLHSDPMNHSLDDWRAYFKAVHQSDFLMGRIEGKDWRADFDFLLTEKSITGVIEGKYHAKTRPATNAVQHPARAPTPAERVAAKRAAARSSDMGAVVEDVGDVRPYLVTGSGR